MRHMNNRTGIGCVVSAAILAWGAPASAGHLDISGYGTFGFGGEAETEGPAGYSDTGADLEATAGFGFGVDYSVWDYIDVGGRIAFAWYATESMDNNNIDRNAYVDIMALVKGQYPFFDGAMEVYVAFPIGFTTSILSDEFENAVFPGQSPDAPIGMNAGLYGGFSYAFLDFLGAFIELGWQMHWIKTSVSGGFAGDLDYETTAHQFGLQTGVFFRI